MSQRPSATITAERGFNQRTRGFLAEIFGGIIIAVLAIVGLALRGGVSGGIMGVLLGGLAGLGIGIVAIIFAIFGAIASTIGGFIGGLLAR